jgi:hypothetical protein
MQEVGALLIKCDWENELAVTLSATLQDKHE